MEEAGSPRNGRKGATKTLIPEGLLPSYLACAFGDLYEEDGLIVLGKGLGLLSLLASFIRFYGDVKNGHASIQQASQEDIGLREQGKAPLVLVLGLRDSEQESLLAILEAWGTLPKEMPTVITNEAGQGKDRAAMYQRGGVFCVTSRILIVDLLNNVIASKDVDGMLIAHADEITHDSTEAFIVRIYASQKRRDKSFIKAFTDSPDNLFSGFAKIDKTLKALQVQRLHLYPRFHDAVRNELEAWAPDIEELHQPLSPTMKEIQSAIVAAVKTCMKELKSSTPFVEWTSTDLAIENCVTSSFDRAIHRQLEKDWHKLKPQTKQLSSDLATLRNLFHYLVTYDCVAFWRLINNIKTRSAASARNPSMWLLSPAAEVLFKKAKERMYRIEKRDPTRQVPNPVSRLVPILEGNPKWKLLEDVLGRIRKEERQKARKVPATVLIVAKDERTAESVRSFLVEGRDRTMALQWLRFLESYNDRSRSIPNCKISEESRLLLEEEQRVRRKLFGGNNKFRNSGQEKKRNARHLNEVPSYIRKRRRIAIERSRGQLSQSSREDRERKAILDEAVEETEHSLETPKISINAAKPDDSDDGFEMADMFHTSMIEAPRLVINTYGRMDGDAASTFLADVKPNHVILYDSDVAFVRNLEVYSALCRPADRLKVYFLVFQGSAEQKVFSNLIEREQNAFERLINHKQTMPIPVLTTEGTQEMEQALANGSAGGSYNNGNLPLAFDSRKAKKPENQHRNIVVDVREFRSALPSILHQGGMRLAPVTLTVGDFVLSKVHCVERKSISDLFGSFASGRLYTQAEQMSKYYKCPCLLIEFDPTKSFCLQNSNELGVDIKSDSICSKLVLLTSHFQKLRILWSKSPHETLNIFRELKSNREEVDVDKAVECGRDESADALLRSQDNCDEEDEVNEAARDMLLRLPGVNIHSAGRIMRECDSLAELAEMDRMELRRIAGPVAGQKLYRFFRQTLGGT